jgi:hypothetical protein
MDLNEYIARSPMNGFYLDAYLKNVLGFQEGINQRVLGCKNFIYGFV